MEELRPLLAKYAYNITGSYEDAKDIVQDAFLQFIKIDHQHIENKKAYLVRTVVNLAINFKNRQKKFAAQYPGHWLPEPVATELADDPVNRKEILSYSIMVLIEKLNSKQRAVFILKEAFDYDHEEIAEILSITVESSRKLLSRAKKEIQSETPVVKQNIERDYLEKFLQVMRAGDTIQLEQMLVEDIQVTSDGGGKAVAFLNQVNGRKDVTSLLTGLFRKFYNEIKILPININHQPALLYFEGEMIVTCQILQIEDNRVTDIYFMRNPDKLRALANKF